LFADNNPMDVECSVIQEREEKKMEDAGASAMESADLGLDAPAAQEDDTITLVLEKDPTVRHTLPRKWVCLSIVWKTALENDAGCQEIPIMNMSASMLNAVIWYLEHQ